MHERALMADLVRKVLAVAEAEGAGSVARIRGAPRGAVALHPEHFVEHWLDASRGTIAEGSAVDAAMDESLTGEAAQGVLLESVEVSG